LGMSVGTIASAYPFSTIATNQDSRCEVSFCHRN
jgi:hypothetical protein